MADDLRNAFESRLSLLSHVANALEQETRDYLSELVNTNQVRFRLLETDDFLTKAERDRFADPLVEIEDQIVGYVMVRPDAPPIVEQRLQDVYSAVEGKWQAASDDGRAEFPTRCLICVIPPHVKPPGWDARNDVPKTFELRVCVDPTLPAQPPDAVDAISTVTEGRVLFGLHGIRTHADWCRALYEVAPNHGWQVRMDRWNFGYFNVFRFLRQKTRSEKVTWFQKTYREETQDKDVSLSDGQCPSIVAHSFGTLILGNALLKYDWLKFNKVILCGSILSQDFPWDRLIGRGQVQAVRNEYGVKDFWAGIVQWFVAGTGPSGRTGFTCSHERFEQEEFVYEHSEYFNKSHMEAKWFPFLARPLCAVAKPATRCAKMSKSQHARGNTSAIRRRAVVTDASPIPLRDTTGTPCDTSCTTENHHASIDGIAGHEYKNVIISGAISRQLLAADAVPSFADCIDASWTFTPMDDQHKVHPCNTHLTYNHFVQAAAIISIGRQEGKYREVLAYHRASIQGLAQHIHTQGLAVLWGASFPYRLGRNRSVMDTWMDRVRTNGSAAQTWFTAEVRSVVTELLAYKIDLRDLPIKVRPFAVITNDQRDRQHGEHSTGRVYTQFVFRIGFSERAMKDSIQPDIGKRVYGTPWCCIPEETMNDDALERVFCQKDTGQPNVMDILAWKGMFIKERRIATGNAILTKGFNLT